MHSFPTLLGVNMEPKNGPFSYYFPLKIALFRFHVDSQGVYRNNHKECIEITTSGVYPKLPFGGFMECIEITPNYKGILKWPQNLIFPNK